MADDLNIQSALIQVHPEHAIEPSNEPETTKPTTAPNESQPEDQDMFVIVDHDPSTMIEKDRIELYKTLEKELTDQASRCKQYEEQFTHSGDIAMAAKFKIFAASCAKDIDLLHIRWKNGDKFPLVKHETFEFSIVPCNYEISSNELSVEVVKGINLPVSSDTYTYLTAEFDHPPSGNKQTGSVAPKPSQNPQYDQRLKFTLDRDTRTTLRTVKRRPIILDVYKKEPFWRCDSKIGSVTIKLGEIANKCTIHDIYPVMNGRRATDSKVEVIVKVRNALVNKDPELVTEKWLVFT